MNWLRNLLKWSTTRPAPTEGLKTPTLPEGYRFVVSKDEDGDVMIEIKKGSRAVATSYVRFPHLLRVDDIKNHTLERMSFLKKRLASELEDNVRRVEVKKIIDDICGDYPPREYL